MTGAFVESMFTGVLNQSISASWLIFAVILIRVCIKKIPKSLHYVLWALVAVRLLCPISIESPWSLVPVIEVSSQESEADSLAVGEQGYLDEMDYAKVVLQNMELEVPEQNKSDVSVEVLADEVVDLTDVSTSKGSFSIGSALLLAAGIWLLGIVVIVFSSVIGVIRLKNQVGASLQIGEQVWMCDAIQSPFILGLISPRIYVPSFITKEQLPLILAHENEHLKYRDHWWKPFGFAILTIHWFNPLVWIAYILMCRDMELACDERVIRHMGEAEKKQYSRSLLLCNNPRYLISACPVAFGEIGVKERVKSILDYKKPSIWMLGIGVCVCIIIAVCFMTNPKRITLNVDVEKVAKIELQSGSSGKEIEITDEDVILRITDHINKLEFQKKGSTAGHGGWSYWLTWYDAEGNEMESFTTVGENRIAKDDYFYQSVNGNLDEDYYKQLLQGIADTDEIIRYNGREYKKSTLCNATLRWLEMTEMERSLSSYFPPEFAVFAEKWGVTLDVEDVTPTSLTLKCTQSGGRPTGELQTGTWYVLQTWTQEYGWREVDYLPHEYEIAWTQEAWIIPMNDTCEWEVNWEWLYGELPEGKYRIGKEIMDFRDAGDYDSTIYYAEFEIVE